MDALGGAERSLDENGIDWIGPVERETGTSIYFFDPSGHRLELYVRSARNKEVLAAAKEEAHPMLEEWNKKWHPETATG